MASPAARVGVQRDQRWALSPMMSLTSCVIPGAAVMGMPAHFPVFGFPKWLGLNSSARAKLRRLEEVRFVACKPHNRTNASVGESTHNAHTRVHARTHARTNVLARTGVHMRTSACALKHVPTRKHVPQTHEHPRPHSRTKLYVHAHA